MYIFKCILMAAVNLKPIPYQAYKQCNSIYKVQKTKEYKHTYCKCFQPIKFIDKIYLFQVEKIEFSKHIQ